MAVAGAKVIVGAAGDDTGAINAGRAYVYDLGSATLTLPQAILHKNTPSADDYFGGSVAISGTLVVIGVSRDDAGATNAGKVFVYDLSSGIPNVPVFKLSHPAPQADDFFGSAVAISGTRLVVGAWGRDIGASDAGSAYVFNLSSGTPTVPVATLNNPTPAASDSFGITVAISGTKMGVGSPWDDTGASDAGSAYVYALDGATPTIPAFTLNSPSPSQDDRFGWSVAITGTKAVIGSYQDDTGAYNAGIVYVYDVLSETPTVPVFTLNNPQPAANGQFGYSVAISGPRIVVGTGWNVYVYDISGSTPTAPVATLNNPDPTPQSFGSRVAIDGTRVIVGTEAGNGKAYIYELSSGTPTVPVWTLNNPGLGASDYFGYRVAISGTRAAVGAGYDDTGATNAGRVYVYDLTSGTPTVPSVTVNNPTPAADDNFGSAIALFGQRLVVGAYSDDSGAMNAGSAYVFDLNSSTPAVPELTLNNPEPAEYDHFGVSVAISGTRLVVGAPQDTTGARAAGSVYVYELSGATPSIPVAKLTNPTPSVQDFFGAAVGISGARAVIGAHSDDTVSVDKGYAYVFGPNPNDTDSDDLPDSWEIARFGTIGAHGALDDSDGDGRVELLEFAFNADPLVADVAASPQAVNEDGYLTMTIAKRAGVTFSVQSAATPEAAAFTSTTTTVLLDNATTLKVRDNVLIGSPLSRFLRVKVTAAP